MNNTTNDERLRILQERLAQINQKSEPENSNTQVIKNEEAKESSSNEKQIHIKQKAPSWGLEKETKRSSSWMIKFILIGITAYGLFYLYNLESTPANNQEVIKEKEVPFTLKYNLDFQGAQIAIINSFKEEESAKSMVNELRIKGFTTDYFFLPDKSNSNEEIYKVFIGPYQSLEETNQWKKNISSKVEILNLN